MGSVGSGLLAGRQAECEVLGQSLARLSGGSSQVIEVTGDPGIGKTRLLAELADRASDHGFLVLNGRARRGVAVPFDVFVDALDDYLAGFGCDPPEPQLEVLGSIFPSLSRPQLPGLPVPGERHHLFRAMKRLLQILPSPGLVLILDDLHLAGEETHELLAQLISQPPRRPLLLAFAYRWRQAPARLRAAVAAARGDHQPTCLRLGPLTEADAEGMLAGRGSRTWRRALYQASAGNPFYLDALARSAHRQTQAGNGRPGSVGPGGAPLPPDVAAALIAELDALSPAAQLSARSAAVIGDTFCAEALAAVAGLDEDGAASAIVELAAAELIRPVEPTHLFSFRHALVTAAVYESANPAWRVAAHGRAAAALRNCGVPLTAQADHIGRTADLGDLRAVGLLADAANTVQTQAPALAAHWLRAALRLLPAGAGATPHRTELLSRLAFALGAAGHPEESRATLHAVLPELRSDRNERRATAVIFCALMERQLGRHAEAQALLRAELPALDDQDMAAMAAVRYELGCGELVCGDLSTACEWALQALAAAGRNGPAGLRCAVLGLLATTDAMTGDMTGAATHLSEANALLDGMLDSELAQRLDAALWAGCSELLLERPHAALRHLDRGLTLARDNGQVLIVGSLLVCRLVILLRTGKLAEASATAEEAVEVTTSSGSAGQQAASLALRSLAAAWTGDLDGARTAAASAKRTGLPDGWLGTLAAQALGDAHLALGDPQGCLGLAAGPPPDAAWARVGWCELLTRAELAAGHEPAAARWAEAATASARCAGLPGLTGLALLARAQVITAADPPAASELAATAVRMLNAAGMALDAGRAALAGATALAAGGDLKQARDAAWAAQSTFEACGSRHFADQAAAVRRRITASGSRRSRRKGLTTAGGPLTVLTRREQEVAALVSQGLTNRSIAQRLYVTEKTIEMHLSNVFLKLGVSSRTEAAAAVIRAQPA